MTQQIAITGGAGFLGSHVVDFFSRQGEDVVVVDDFSDGRKENLSDARDDVEIRRVDLTNREAAISSFEGINRIVHLAAKIGGIGYFHDVPADIIGQNNEMTRNVLDAARKEDVDRVVYASSSMVFEKATDFPVSEDQVDEIPPPKSAYGFQKLSGEYYCRAYHDQYNVDYAIFRPFNAVGPREPPGDEVGQAHVIPDFVKKILTEQQYPLEVLGDGSQVRAFTHVTDIARGVHACTFQEAAENDDFNLGSSDGVTMTELAKKIWEHCDREKEIAFDSQKAFEHDVDCRIPDSSKAKRVLGWKPEVSLSESLEEYIHWYRDEIQ